MGGLPGLICEDLAGNGNTMFIYSVPMGAGHNSWFIIVRVRKVSRGSGGGDGHVRWWRGYKLC